MEMGFREKNTGTYIKSVCIWILYMYVSVYVYKINNYVYIYSIHIQIILGPFHIFGIWYREILVSETASKPIWFHLALPNFSVQLCRNPKAMLSCSWTLVYFFSFLLTPLIISRSKNYSAIILGLYVFQLVSILFSFSSGYASLASELLYIYRCI